MYQNQNYVLLNPARNALCTLCNEHVPGFKNSVPLSSLKQFKRLSSNALLTFGPSITRFIKYDESQFNLEPNSLKYSTNC